MTYGRQDVVLDFFSQTVLADSHCSARLLLRLDSFDTRRVFLSEFEGVLVGFDG